MVYLPDLSSRTRRAFLSSPLSSSLAINSPLLFESSIIGSKLPSVFLAFISSRLVPRTVSWYLSTSPGWLIEPLREEPIVIVEAAAAGVVLCCSFCSMAASPSLRGSARVPLM